MLLLFSGGHTSMPFAMVFGLTKFHVLITCPVAAYAPALVFVCMPVADSEIKFKTDYVLTLRK